MSLGDKFMRDNFSDDLSQSGSILSKSNHSSSENKSEQDDDSEINITESENESGSNSSSEFDDYNEEDDDVDNSKRCGTLLSRDGPTSDMMINSATSAHANP